MAGGEAHTCAAGPRRSRAQGWGAAQGPSSACSGPLLTVSLGERTPVLSAGGRVTFPFPPRNKAEENIQKRRDPDR